MKDGRLVAFTDLQVPLAQPERAHQGGTLVLREHRGHRLGALMKAAVLRELAATMPEVRRISTYNSEDNTPMVAVNEALGFRPAGQLSTWSLRLRPEPGGRAGDRMPRAPHSCRQVPPGGIPDGMTDETEAGHGSTHHHAGGTTGTSDRRRAHPPGGQRDAALPHRLRDR